MKRQQSHLISHTTSSAGRFCVVCVLLFFMMLPACVSGAYNRISSDTEKSKEASIKQNTSESADNEKLSALYIADSTEVYGLENFSESSSKDAKISKSHAYSALAPSAEDQLIGDTSSNKDRALSQTQVRTHEFAMHPDDVFFHNSFMSSSPGVIVGQDYTFFKITHNPFYIRHPFHKEKRRIAFPVNCSLQVGKCNLLYSRPPPMPLSVTYRS